MTRTLTRDEVLMYVTVMAGAGNETTGRLIGWMGSTLAKHPEQRAELVADPSLIPGAVEEVLRLEPPGPFIARYVTKPDAELYGQVVPAGSAMLMPGRRGQPRPASGTTTRTGSTSAGRRACT